MHVEYHCGLERNNQVNNGTKKKDLDRTGYKGLGFKAVFGKSDYVIIYSNGEYFRFDASHKILWNKQWGSDNQENWEKENDRLFIYPWQINPIWTNENEILNAITNFIRSRRSQIQVANIIQLNNIEEIHQETSHDESSSIKSFIISLLFLIHLCILAFSLDDTPMINEDYTVIFEFLKHALQIDSTSTDDFNKQLEQLFQTNKINELE